MHMHAHIFTHMRKCTHARTHTHTQKKQQHTFNPSVAPSDYGNLTNFRLDQFSDDMRELSFNVCIADNSILDGDETFSVSLTLNSAGQDRRVTVSPNVATVIIRDDGK